MTGGCAPSRAFRESLPCFAEAPSEAEGDSRRGALPNCRHLTLRCPEAAPRPFSSHFSCTAITDTESQSCNNSPTVQHRELHPSPETDPSSAAKSSSAALCQVGDKQ